MVEVGKDLWVSSPGHVVQSYLIHVYRLLFESSGNSVISWKKEKEKLKMGETCPNCLSTPFQKQS